MKPIVTALALGGTALCAPAFAQEAPDWTGTAYFTAPEGAEPGALLDALLAFETTEMTVVTDPEGKFIDTPWAWWGIFDFLAAQDPEGAAPLFELDAGLFPGLSVEVVAEDGTILPAERGILRRPVADRTGSFWELIVSPGETWALTGDDEGWSRAAFPVSLVQSQEGEAWLGLAAFDYSGDEVTDLRVQFSSDSAGGFIFWDPDFDMQAWAEVPMEVTRDAGATASPAAPEFETAPLSELAPVQALAETADPDKTLAVAVLQDDKLYTSEVDTPFGPHPYPLEMRVGVWSVSKSLIAGMSALRLAEKFGPEFLEAPITSFFEEGAEYEFASEEAAARFNAVTIRDALNMSSGMGPTGYDTNWAMDAANTYEWGYSYDLGTQVARYFAQEPNPDVTGPGEALVYIDQDMWIAALAMERYLQQQEGPDATLLGMLQEEVYGPLGVAHFAAGTGYTDDGSPGFPFTAWGALPTLPDLARAGALLANGGAAPDGTQVLSATLVEELFASGDYALSFWKMALPEGGHALYMSGSGGNYVMIPQGGPVGVVLGRDDYNHAWSDEMLAEFAAALGAL